jgi:hypothetical protein
LKTATLIKQQRTKCKPQTTTPSNQRNKQQVAILHNKKRAEQLGYMAGFQSIPGIKNAACMFQPFLVLVTTV